jgi:hypothetical protein
MSKQVEKPQGNELKKTGNELRSEPFNEKERRIHSHFISILNVDVKVSIAK